jgi:hypothetical protein
MHVHALKNTLFTNMNTKATPNFEDGIQAEQRRQELTIAACNVKVIGITFLQGG